MADESMLKLVDEERMNLLGLMVGGILEARLATPQGASLARKLRGAVGVTAGKMKITVEFMNGHVEISRELKTGLKSSVRSSLDGLLQVSLGRGAVRSFLSGDVSFSGNPFFLLKMIPLLRAVSKE